MEDGSRGVKTAAAGKPSSLIAGFPVEQTRTRVSCRSDVGEGAAWSRLQAARHEAGRST